MYGNGISNLPPIYRAFLHISIFSSLFADTKSHRPELIPVYATRSARGACWLHCKASEADRQECLVPHAGGGSLPPTPLVFGSVPPIPVLCCPSRQLNQNGSARGFPCSIPILVPDHPAQGSGSVLLHMPRPESQTHQSGRLRGYRAEILPVSRFPSMWLDSRLRYK